MHRVKTLYEPKAIHSLFTLFIYQFVFFLISMTTITAVYEWRGLSDQDLGIQIYASILAFTMLLFWLTRNYRINFRALFITERVNSAFLFPMLLGVVGADILISEFGNRMQAFLTMDQALAKTLMGLFETEAGLVKSILLAVIIAPFLEEFVFRGLLLRGFLQHYSAKKAVLISAFLFGIFHMNIWQFPGAVVWGVIAGWWFVETRSLIPCIYGHMLMNGLGLLGVVLRNHYNIIIPGFNSDMTTVQFQPIWFTAIGIIMLLIGIKALFKLFMHFSS